jgi:tripartite-type tricarboxylate transporter receptor subunit TctC
MWAGAAGAQTRRGKPIRCVVPTGPGSAVDVDARRVTPKLAGSLGQPVIVDNRSGANSMIAARALVEVVRAHAGKA